MLPLVKMMGGGPAGPTQDTICYYAGEDIYYKFGIDDTAWKKWTGTVVTVGNASSPAGGAPYDYSSIEDAADDNAGDVAIMAHWLGVDDAWTNGFYTYERNMIIKGVGCVRTLEHRSRNPNPPDGVQFNGSTGNFFIGEAWHHRSQENWYSAFAFGRESNMRVYLNKMDIYGTGDTYMLDFYKNNQAWRGTCEITYCRLSRGYTTIIDHYDGSTPNKASIRKCWHYNNGQGNYLCYSCAAAPDPLDYMESLTNPSGSGYGYDAGDYIVKFGPS